MCARKEAKARTNNGHLPLLRAGINRATGSVIVGGIDCDIRPRIIRACGRGGQGSNAPGGIRGAGLIKGQRGD